jgi:uncharacterized protein YdcH (DUF465 family)
LCSAIFSTVNAFSFSSLSFHGVGITVELVFPEEAHPEDNIDHNVTITSQTNPEINVFNLTIYGTINQTLQEIKSLFLSLDLDAPFTKRINVSLPKETLGRLYCTLYVKTDQDTDYYFTSFYTTQVNPITFSELLVSYDLKVIEFNNKVAQFNSLLDDYTNLDKDHSILLNNYVLKNASYTMLLEEYDTLNSTSADLEGNYTELLNLYNLLNEDSISLQIEIDDLIIQKEIYENSLETDRNLMVIFIIILVSLIGLIIYLRNKQKEPYVVIRKETVSVKPEKNKK